MTRVLFHVQHLLGVGHLRRAELIAAAMAAAGLDVTVALGGLPVPEVPFAGIRVAQLPPATIAGEDFSALLDAQGRPVDADWKDRRTAALLDIHRRLDPDVVLIELYPFGRRQFRFELDALLQEIHAGRLRPQVACSVRDILVASQKPGRTAEIVATLRRSFDAVLVHGDPALIPLDATFPAVAEVEHLIRYTGYVATGIESRPAEAGHGEVLVSAGGGAVGAPLLAAALAARPLTALRDRVWRLLTGPNLPVEAFDALMARADQRTIVERFRADFPARLAAAELSISQAGYNTTMEILQAGARAVVVPYETASETEQRLRSGILADKGWLTVVPAAELTAERLARGIAEALGKRRTGPAAVDFSGGAGTARLVADLAARRGSNEFFKA